ncbi:hypothetical protein F443_18839, partial [Phytophthora nicotianae P1569]
MRTHPVFYVGLLKPYKDPARVSAESLAPNRQRAARPRAAAGHAQHPGPGCESTGASTNSPRGGTSLRDRPLRDERGRSRQGRMRREDSDAVSASADSQRGNPAETRPPPALLDEHGEPHYHVERLVARRRHRGRTQYLVKWRGYPYSQNSWEFEMPLREDCRDVVDAYDVAHPLPIRHMVSRLRRQALPASSA